MNANSAHPPSNIEAEESILGGILLDPEAFGRVSGFLKPEHFYLKSHQEIYRAAQALGKEFSPIDLMTVTTWLADKGKLEAIGGTMKLATLLDRTVSAVNIDRYSKLVIDKFRRRRLIDAALELEEWGYDTSLELPDLLDRSEQRVFEVCQLGDDDGAVHCQESFTETFFELDEDRPILPTWIPGLDDLIFGWVEGTTTVLAGRTSMGKSKIAVYAACRMVVSNKKPVLFCSLEMSRKQMDYRFWSCLSTLPELDLEPIEQSRMLEHRTGKRPLSPEELQGLSEIVGVAEKLPLYQFNKKNSSVPEIASEARKIISKHGELGLVVIDYIQLMRSDSSVNRHEQLDDLMTKIFNMGQEMRVPILLLSQLNRQTESRQDKRPNLADFSGSDAIAQRPDVCVAVYRPEYYDPNTEDKGLVELHVLKGRDCYTGMCKAAISLEYNRLSQPDYASQ